MRSLDLSAAGALREERRFHLISHNLSNAQVVGYKKDVPRFSLLLAQALTPLEAERADTSRTSFQQGNILKTGNDLDLAIEGEGFFKVMTPRGVRYTRSGQFRLDREGRLVSASGFPVLGQKGEIKVSGKAMVIEKDGRVKLDGEEADRIALVTFDDLTQLTKESLTLFAPKMAQQEREVEAPLVLQGYLEESNVNALQEMVNLIDTLRSYEANMKVIQAKDELTGKVVNEMGRV
ncbi:MAG: flagellar basal-body rod protein FlgF [Desulfobacterota bacterium]|nr:flagellar basal-body rod protein FlgF [Thermodesulfobacteriota bacterium]